MTNVTMRRAYSVSIFARDPGGRVLLIKHKRLDAWLPPGGEIEDGETPLQAARREMIEETGLTPRFVDVDGVARVDGMPAGLLAYEEHDAGSKGRHLNFCFAADVDDDIKASAASAGEYTEHRWVERGTDVPCPANVAQLVELARGGNVAVARRWLAFFNARDLDGLLSLYAD
ncbi:MAG TPA: NUDIX domain-containing protein, partial [Myxococcota bacterium]